MNRNRISIRMKNIFESKSKIDRGNRSIVSRRKKEEKRKKTEMAKKTENSVPIY